VRCDELRAGDVVLGSKSETLLAVSEYEMHWLSLDDAHEVRMAPSTAEIKGWRLIKGGAWAKR